MTTFRTEPSRKETGTKKGRKNRKERFPFLLFLSCLIHATLIILLALLFAKGITKKPLPTSEPPPPQITLEISPPQPAAAQHPPQPASPPSNPSLPGTSGSKKGYQPETRQTVIRGNISNRGPSSVAAEATPIGRFKKQVATHIGSRWYKYIDERMGLISIGTVSVTFKVTASGQVKDLRVISSNGNQSLTDCSLRSIMDAKLPPIPPEVAPTLQNGCLEIDYSFTIY